jgi:rRNA maturation RNase YbeY
MAVSFNQEDISFKLKNSIKFKQLLNKLAVSENRKLADINYVFCSDNYLLEINKKYLNHNYFTDVITFDYSENNKISGDIFISIDTINDNAKRFETDSTTELHRVMIHGALHLIGYNDKSNEDKKLMTQKEDFYLNVLDNI